MTLWHSAEALPISKSIACHTGYPRVFLFECLASYTTPFFSVNHKKRGKGRGGGVERAGERLRPADEKRAGEKWPFSS